MRRSLVLRKERLAELDAADLAAVNGGLTPSCPLFLRIRELLDELTNRTECLQ